MVEKELVGYIEDAAAAAAQLMDAEKNVFELKAVPEEAVGHSNVFHLGGQAFRFGLRQDAASNFLLNTFIGVTAERIRSNSFPMENAPEGLFVPSVGGPCTPQQWGEDLYRDVQNRLIQSFGVGLALEFDLINSLSAQRYEGASCRGGIVFESDEKADVGSRLSMSIEAAEEIRLKKDMVRQIRKLLAGAGGDFLVFHRRGREYICKGYCSEEISAQFKWRVLFTDVLDWKFYHYGDALFRFFHNDPKVVRDPIVQVLEELKQEFGSSFDAGKARPLLQSGLEQSHGTALIFMDLRDGHISDWIGRLYDNKRAICLVTCGSAQEAVRRLSGMDGALLIDVRTMEIAYFAAIVDGHVKVKGDLARGARHNSILTFVSDLVRSSPDHASRLGAVVFSEDGGAVTICGRKYR